MALGTIHRSPGIYFTAEENTRKLQTVVEGCVTSHRLIWDPLPPNEVGRVVCLKVKKYIGNANRALYLGVFQELSYEAAAVLKWDLSYKSLHLHENKLCKEKLLFSIIIKK